MAKQPSQLNPAYSSGLPIYLTILVMKCIELRCVFHATNMVNLWLSVLRTGAGSTNVKSLDPGPGLDRSNANLVDIRAQNWWMPGWLTLPAKLEPRASVSPRCG